MQELTKTICASSLEHDIKQLIDNRDDKRYQITKLRDGNCWMTQNLDYNDPNSIRITDVTKWTSTDTNYRAYYDAGDEKAGNYYSWQAATNGTGGSISSGNATGSICPAGWQLPSSNSTTVNGSFGKLTTAYGISNDATGSTKMQSAPLNFTLGGYVYSGSLRSAGSDGYYWSSTVYTSPFAYALNFFSSVVNPSNDSIARYRGLSVRCLVQGS